MEVGYKSHFKKHSQVEQEVTSLKGVVEKLKNDLKEEGMSGLLSRDQGFQKAKTQALCLCPDLDLSELDCFKVVVDGFRVDEIEPELTPGLDATSETKFFIEGQTLEKTNSKEVMCEKTGASSHET